MPFNRHHAGDPEPGGAARTEQDGPVPPEPDESVPTEQDGPADDARSEPAGEAGQAPSPATHPTATRFVFIDTEATGLDHERHELTEVSWIVRFEDGTQRERQYFPVHTLDGADDGALEITHYHERIASQTMSPASEWLATFLEDADGAVLVGAVPDFDARHLERAARKVQRTPTWDHHLLDVETLALPLIAPGPEAPRSLAATCAALGIPHDRDKAHGALYDAQQAMRVFDAVWAKLAELRAAASPLPDPVPRARARAAESAPVPPSTSGDTRATDGTSSGDPRSTEQSGSGTLSADQSDASTTSSRV